MAQAVFKSWFVDFEPFRDGEFVNSEFGRVPKGWQIIKFSSFLTPRFEKSNDPSIMLFSVTDNGIFPRNEKFSKKLSSTNTKNKIARKTDLVFGMSREILNWGIMRSGIGGVSSAYSVFAVDSGINSRYLESFIKIHPFYFKDLIRLASREGQGIDKGALMQKSIYLPPDSILVKYYKTEDSLTEDIQSNINESTHLTTLRDTLLPRLMSGELPVAGLDGVK
jgi:type I restriction enzyme S subunit